MKTKALVLVLLLLAVTPLLSDATSDKAPSNPLIQGTWQAGTNSGWQVLPDRLRFADRKGLSGEYEILRQEPPSNGDWTIDLWVAQYEHIKSFTFFIGQWNTKTGHFDVRVRPDGDDGQVSITASSSGKSLPSGGGSFRCASGRIQWIRIIHSADGKRMTVWINGRAIPWQATDISLPAAPVGFRVQAGQTDQNLDIRFFRVHPEARHAESSSQGPAFRGWQKPPSPDSIRTAKGLVPCLEGLCADQSLSDPGRAYALSAMAISDSATLGRVSNEHWKQISDFVQATMGKDRSAVAIVLPIAVACGDVNQRTAARSWVDALFVMKPSEQSSLKARGYDFSRRAALLDPVAAIWLAADDNVTSHLAAELGEDFGKTYPLPVMALYCACIAAGDHRSSAMAWMLPELQFVSRSYYKFAIEYLHAYGNRKNMYPSYEPDCTLSLAAYRLAQVDAEESLRFLNQISKPEVKAETLQYMASELTPAQSTDIEQMIESCLKDAVTQWKPRKEGDTPSAEMLRLAKYYQSRGRTKDALAVVKNASEWTPASPKEQFNHVLGIARILKACHAPQAASWWTQAANLALDLDSQGVESTDGLYISPVTSMIMELTREDRIDEALALLARMNPELAQSRAICASAIISRVSGSDIRWALQLLQQMPEGSPRYSLAATLASRLAKQDLRAALAMIESLPPDFRAKAALDIARSVPGNDAVITAVRSALTECLPPSDSRTGIRGSMEFLKRLYELPLPTLLELEPCFVGDKKVFAQQVLSAVAVNCGLESDSLWQAFADADQLHDKPIPWGTSALRYAVAAK